MKYIIKVTTLNDDVFYHNRGQLTWDVPYKFKSMNYALRVARKIYGPKLGYSLRNWEVSEVI